MPTWVNSRGWSRLQVKRELCSLIQFRLVRFGRWLIHGRFIRPAQRGRSIGTLAPMANRNADPGCRFVSEFSQRDATRCGESSTNYPTNVSCGRDFVAAGAAPYTGAIFATRR